jgi:hypothetical protein
VGRIRVRRRLFWSLVVLVVLAVLVLALGGALVRSAQGMIRELLV